MCVEVLAFVKASKLKTILLLPRAPSLNEGLNTLPLNTSDSFRTLGFLVFAEDQAVVEKKEVPSSYYIVTDLEKEVAFVEDFFRGNFKIADSGHCQFDLLLLLCIRNVEN
jgi:hypothetical protein